MKFIKYFILFVCFILVGIFTIFFVSPNSFFINSLAKSTDISYGYSEGTLHKGSVNDFKFKNVGFDRVEYKNTIYFNSLTSVISTFGSHKATIKLNHKLNTNMLNISINTISSKIKLNELLNLISLNIEKGSILYDFNNSRCESANGNGYVSNDLLGRINLNIECRNGRLIAILKKNRINVGQVRLYDNYVETEISRSVLPSRMRKFLKDEFLFIRSNY